MAKYQAFRVHQENNEVVGWIEDITVDDLDEGDVLINIESLG